MLNLSRALKTEINDVDSVMDPIAVNHTDTLCEFMLQGNWKPDAEGMVYPFDGLLEHIKTIVTEEEFNRLNNAAVGLSWHHSVTMDEVLKEAGSVCNIFELAQLRNGIILTAVSKIIPRLNKSNRSPKARDNREPSVLTVENGDDTFKVVIPWFMTL